MLRCNACHADFTGYLARCPLCQGELRGEPVPSPLPSQRVFLHPRQIAVQIVSFAVCAAIVLLAFFTYWFHWPWRVALASGLCLLATMLYANNGILRAVGPLRMLFRAFYLVLAGSAIWFALTGSRIITMMVVPITCIAAIAFSAVVLIVLRLEALERFFKYCVFNVVFALVPLLFIALGWAPWKLLALVSALCAALFACGLGIFASRLVGREFRKQFSA